MSIIDFYHRHRRKIIGLGFTMAIPAGLIAALMTMAITGPSEDAMRTAAIALDAYYSDNPPNGVWEYQGVRIVDDKRIVVDVHVSVVPHATVIESRNNRIRYSYMKLACPSANQMVENWTDDVLVWINLNFHGKTLIEGACPKQKQGALFVS
ncbi:MAG: hypothetical protein HOH04_01330 [Rhodospirillaceae bacterium]|jgi:hypothetical protein|nr:hypothetical protein [Rhodospirillaceae bacterium]